MEIRPAVRALNTRLSGMLLLSLSIAPHALSGTTSAQALADAVFARPNGGDEVTVNQMQLLRPDGSLQRERSFVSYRRDIDALDSQVLLRFESPANIRNTGLLIDSSADSVWLYLPALDKVRRISSRQQGGRFVQSQVYYEDLKIRQPQEDHHRLLEAGNYRGVTTQVLESMPKSASSSAYTKRVSWIHPELLVPLRVDFYEGGTEPSKRLEVVRMDEIQGYWTVTESLMTDLERGDSTRISVNSISYDTGLPGSLFTTSALASPETQPAPGIPANGTTGAEAP